MLRNELLSRQIKQKTYSLQNRNEISSSYSDVSSYSLLSLRSFVSTKDLIAIFQALFLNLSFFSYSLSPKRLDGFSWNFQGGVYLSGMAEANFWCDYVTFDPRYWRFSDFQGVVLYRDLLWNDSRYNLQIFRDDKQMAAVCTYWVSSLTRNAEAR